MSKKYFYLGKNEKEDYLQNSWSGIYGNLTNIKYIVLHDYAGGINLTAKQGAKATINRMATNSDSANYHHVVDANSAYSVIREDRCAYHTGSEDGNKYAIGIEIAPSLTSGKFANSADKQKYFNAWKNACKLVADYCVKYNLSTSAIRQHNEFSATSCPYTMKQYFGSYDKALSETKKEVDKNIKIIKGESVQKAKKTYYTSVNIDREKSTDYKYYDYRFNLKVDQSKNASFFKTPSIKEQKLWKHSNGKVIRLNEMKFIDSNYVRTEVYQGYKYWIHETKNQYGNMMYFAHKKEKI